MSKDDSQKAARARNKTVMLTPDMANQMRSKITGGGVTGTEKLDDDLIKSIRKNQAAFSRDGNDQETEVVNAEDLTSDLSNNESGDSSESNSQDSLVEVVDSDDSFLSLDDLVKDAASDDSQDEEKETEQEDLSSERGETEELESSEIDNLLSGSGIGESSDSEVDSSSEDLSNLQGQETEQDTDIIEDDVIENLNKGEDNMVASNDLISWDKETKIIGFLVDYDSDENGVVALLRIGRVIVSSDKVDKGSCFVIDDESVSPMHAIILAKEGGVVVLDQLSEQGTSIEKIGGEKLELSGDKASLDHGDLLSFGERKYKVCLIA